MPELESITIKGFKSIASIEDLPLRAINIVIGPNGSGKSNFIEVFAFLREFAAGFCRQYVIKSGGANSLLHFGIKHTPEMFIKLYFRDTNRQYEIKLKPTSADQLMLSDESIIFTHMADDVNFNVYHFHDTSATSPMKMTADVHDNRYLRPDGANLAAFLYFLREKEPDAYRMIVRTVQLVAPFFADFQLEPQRLNPEKIRLEWKHRKSDDYFDASSLSDGTLRFIALATLFLQPKTYQPSLILLDEPELGLHPYAITMLASLIKQASVQTQILMATQSPTLLDHFAPEDVLVADLIDEGTQLTRLDSAKLEAWLADYSLGQLWEKNELGGRPGGRS